MGKHVFQFDTLATAKQETLYSPALAKIIDSGNSRILGNKVGAENNELIVVGSALSDASIQAKQRIPEVVDLGLSSGTLWAKWNIGATTETGYGKYFAWGCPEGFEASEVSGDIFTEQWYDNQPGHSLIDDIYDDDEEHNPAFAAYGAGYTMPSEYDYQLLIAETNYEWVPNFNDSGINGWKFTNMSDESKYIFIPAGGYGVSGTVNETGNVGGLWTSSYGGSVATAYLFQFDNGGAKTNKDARFGGMSVRAVKTQS